MFSLLFPLQSNSRWLMTFLLVVTSRPVWLHCEYMTVSVLEQKRNDRVTVEGNLKMCYITDAENIHLFSDFLGLHHEYNETWYFFFKSTFTFNTLANFGASQKYADASTTNFILIPCSFHLVSQVETKLEKLLIANGANDKTSLLFIRVKVWFKSINSGLS